MIEWKCSVRGDHISQAVVFVLLKMYIINQARPEYHMSHMVKIMLSVLSPAALSVLIYAIMKYLKVTFGHIIPIRKKKGL